MFVDLIIFEFLSTISGNRRTSSRVILSNGKRLEFAADSNPNFHN